MAELQRGTPLLIQQYKALLKKNYLLSWRSKRSFFLQLFSSFFFILLMFCINKFITFRSHSSNGDVLDPKPLVHPPIPPCEMKFAIRYPCYDFVWSGNNSPRVRSIVGNIMKNNPGRPIPPDKVKSFGTQDEVDTWLFSHPLRCPGALHFVERNATVISYGVQTNSTEVIFHNKNEDPTFKFQIPLQIAAEREITRHLLGDHGFSWTVGFKEFAHPDLSESSHTGSSSDDAVGTLGPTFFFAISMFGFMFQIGSLVGEKELKLRQAMSMMGLYDTSYWLSWLTWEALISAVSSLFTVLFGTMFRLNLFRHNNFVILFLLFFLFQLNMIGFAFMISTFITKASSTSTVGFSILVIGFLTQPFSSILYDQGVRKLYRALWSLFPPNLLAEALSIFGDKNAHISWTTWTKCTDDVDCVITIAGIYTWLISTFLVWFLLAMYFDNIFPNSEGVRKSLFYFLKPGYWTGKGGNRVEGGICSCTSSVPVLEDAIVHDEDVREEEHVVKQQVTEGVDSNVAVQIRGLVKTYPGTRKLVCCCCCCCCKCKTTSPYHAIKGLWVNFAKDQLFCLLGPNGAGKTTTINCLTGVTPVTNGDALIYGYSIRSSVGMSHIRRMIGVCPQFDLLWDALSGEEHLELFANIKGMPPSSIKSLAKKSLEEVRLTYAAKMRAGSYSGGMKRRVSFAIALIGDPKLVILDEPTTGMDPITRRHVWNMIEEAKKGRAIVLTTHSMEEADILADRIGIMAKGKLRCIGTSIRLKSRFGAGFVVTVSFQGSATGQIPDGEGNEEATSDLHREEVKHFFREWLNVVPKEETNAFLTFVIPHEKEELLTCFLEELVSRDREFGISDIQLGLTTLEDVFLNIANKAELESAITEGAFATLKLESGASLQIPKGARFIGIPGTESDENPTGLMVEVYWEQDEGGVYSITGHSPETPIPLNARPVAFPALNQNANLGRTRHVLGLVIDPNDIEGRNN